MGMAKPAARIAIATAGRGKEDRFKSDFSSVQQRWFHTLTQGYGWKVWFLIKKAETEPIRSIPVKRRYGELL
jgi:hypothetical protein